MGAEPHNNATYKYNSSQFTEYFHVCYLIWSSHYAVDIYKAISRTDT